QLRPGRGRLQGARQRRRDPFRRAADAGHRRRRRRRPHGAGLRGQPGGWPGGRADGRVGARTARRRGGVHRPDRARRGSGGDRGGHRGRCRGGRGDRHGHRGHRRAGCRAGRRRGRRAGLTTHPTRLRTSPKERFPLMANYTAADIKALREATGAGMLDVKKALDEADGDHAKATEILRVKGLKGVTKREGPSASNGLVRAHVDDGVGTLVEVNCETDFVAKGDVFGALADKVLQQAVATGAADAEALLASEIDGKTLKTVLDEANATIGEKIEVRRVARVEGEKVVAYLHKTSPDLPPQIGVLVAYTGDDEQLARDIAM